MVQMIDVAYFSIGNAVCAAYAGCELSDRLLNAARCHEYTMPMSHFNLQFIGYSCLFQTWNVPEKSDLFWRASLLRIPSVRYDTTHCLRRGWLWLLWPVMLVALLLGVGVWGVAGAESANYSGRMLVGFHAQTDLPALEAELADQGFIVEQSWPDLGLLSARPREGDVRAWVTSRAVLERLPQITFVEEDARIEAADLGQTQRSPYLPNDPLYGEQWGMRKIGMPTAWAITQGSGAVAVAIIDSGIESSHQDLAASQRWLNSIEVNGLPGVDDDNNGYVDDLHGWDWVDDDNQPNDRFGHGTHVVGTLAATIHNGVGVAGMASAVQLLPLRVLDERGSGFISDLIDALVYARTRNVRVVNLSLVLRVDSQALHIAIQNLYAHNIVVVAATGNYGDRVFWPAVYTETLAVAATDPSDLRAVFSNSGPETDLAAPGVGILSTYLNHGYTKSDGTSMATPHVAGLVALVWSLRPDLSNAELVELLQATAVDVNAETFPGPDVFVGSGRIDAAAALLKASEGLNVEVIFPVGTYLTIGQQLQIPIRLTAPYSPTSLPVPNAFISYELVGPSAGGGLQGATGERVRSGQLVSDADGYTGLALTLPGKAGQYSLIISMGRQKMVYDLAVQDGPLMLSFMPAQPQVTVDKTTTIQIHTRTGAGDPFTDELLVTLRTSLGHFRNGEKSLTVMMTNGQLLETFYTGEVVGTADLSIETAGQTLRTSVLVRPGTPHTIVGPKTLSAVDFGGGALLKLELLIYDRFGNLVESGIPVNFYSLGASITPMIALTVEGRVNVQVDLGPWIQGAVPIWAMIPGSFALYQSEAYLLSKRVYMPMLLK